VVLKTIVVARKPDSGKRFFYDLIGLYKSEEMERFAI
jgi:hypothetical protein